MLASQFPEGNTLANFLASRDISDWAMEEKFDGHRMTLAIGGGGSLQAWSRPSRGKDALRRDIPPQVAAALADFPQCTLDGEIRIPGGTHSDVRVFDLVRLLGQDTTGYTYNERRVLLVKMFEGVVVPSPVKLAESVTPSQAFVDVEAWGREDSR